MGKKNKKRKNGATEVVEAPKEKLKGKEYAEELERQIEQARALRAVSDALPGEEASQ